MAQELKDLVESHDLKPLDYLLDLVRLEAEQGSRGTPHRFPGGRADGD
jgi:hypothetical protein